MDVNPPPGGGVGGGSIYDDMFGQDCTLSRFPGGGVSVFSGDWHAAASRARASPSLYFLLACLSPARALSFSTLPFYQRLAGAVL